MELPLIRVFLLAPQLLLVNPPGCKALLGSKAGNPGGDLLAAQQELGAE
jgi:hypothetical protein